MKFHFYSKFVLFFLFIICSAKVCNGQVAKYMKMGDNYLQASDFSHALKYFSLADSIEKNNATINFKMGICHFNSHFKAKSLPYFEKSKQLGNKDPELDIYLGRAYHLNHKFEEAIKHYVAFKNNKIDTSGIKLDPDEDNVEIQENKMVEKYIDRYIEMCKVGIELVDDSLLLVISNMGKKINTKYADYVPVVSADERVLIFTSRRDKTTGGGKDPNDRKFFEDVYIAHRDSSTSEWEEPKNMGTHINTINHDACIGMSPDGHKLFLYRSSTVKNSSGDIYMSTLNGTIWSVPEKMDDRVNTPHWEPSATISSDGKTIYFTSNRPGGFGGTDIYMMHQDSSGKWQDPVNMGAEVNSEYNEDAPYIHPDNITLFFSSRGHRNMGGYDIFTTTYDMEQKKWNKPENAGYPINTADDDIYFVWSADGSKGYFSSWRDDSYGEKDLYIIHRPEGKSNMLIVRGKVVDEKEKKSLFATINIFDLDSNKVIGSYNSNPKTGKYIFALPFGKNYRVSVEVDGYATLNDKINIPARPPFFEMKREYKLQKLELGTTIVFNNVFFDFDKATIRQEAEEDLNQILAFLLKFPQFKVELSGHTDSIGTDRYNKNLSTRRAQSVVKYMTSKGIPKKQMKFKGYGESMPLVSNSTDEGRQTNRRTELKILDTNFVAVTKFKGTNIGYKNEYKTLDKSKTPSRRRKRDLATIRNFNERDDMDRASLVNIPTLNTSTNLPNIDETKIGSIPDKPKTGDVLQQKVHFIQNVSHYLTNYSMQKVNDVVFLLKKYPEMKLKIISYTNAVAPSDTVAKNISKARGETVRKLLLQKGIEEGRLQTEYFIAPTEVANESEEMKELRKRRVEFVVTQ